MGFHRYSPRYSLEMSRTTASPNILDCPSPNPTWKRSATANSVSILNAISHPRHPCPTVDQNSHNALIFIICFPTHPLFDALNRIDLAYFIAHANTANCTRFLHPHLPRRHYDPIHSTSVCRGCLLPLVSVRPYPNSFHLIPLLSLLKSLRPQKKFYFIFKSHSYTYHQTIQYLLFSRV